MPVRTVLSASKGEIVDCSVGDSPLGRPFKQVANETDAVTLVGYEWVLTGVDADWTGLCLSDSGCKCSEY